MENMKNYANLHSHTIHSDGVFTPTELVRVAKAEGYRALAVTDHDTATAYPELKAACEAEGLECIFGVEFSVMNPKDYHIVGFNFDPEYPPMKKYLEQMSLRETDNTRLCFEEAVGRKYWNSTRVSPGFAIITCSDFCFHGGLWSRKTICRGLWKTSLSKEENTHRQ